MRILIVNDDGIKAPGIRKLAELSVQLGEVWVVAPKSQCSAMSQRITLFEDIEVTPECYDVDGVRAYSVGGTPADCVKVALEFLMPEKPDVVFSGINSGYNTWKSIFFTQELLVQQWRRLQMVFVHLLSLIKMIQAGRLQMHILFRL